jgi:hypothetical protein
MIALVFRESHREDPNSLRVRISFFIHERIYEIITVFLLLLHSINHMPDWTVV